jgi:two-component system chemotaxis response regulator CheB
MGRDGASGLLSMRKAGARTFGQNESSCIVYGMPKVAFDVGAVEKQLPLDRLAAAIMSETSTTTRH